MLFSLNEKDTRWLTPKNDTQSDLHRFQSTSMSSYGDELPWDRFASHPARPTLKVYRCHPDAVMPSRAHASDSGWDITLIALDKKISNMVSRYRTGLKLEIPEGYHVKLYARSSLPQRGHTVSNCVGIIDEKYRGELLVTLTKIWATDLDLQLPCCAVQMIMEKKLEYDVIEVSSVDTDTERGQGGFGSSGY